MRLTIITLMALILTACATTGRWGNYATDANPDHTVKMAEDAFNQLAFLYPPAKTHLSIDQPVNDPFGILLVQKLRRAGYGVAEQPPVSSSRSRKAPATEVSAHTASGLQFNYVLDRISPNNYRVSLNVGGQALARLYQIHGTDLAPAGFWAKQEEGRKE